MAVKFAKAVGASEVTVFSSSEGKKERALALGATGYVNYKDADQIAQAAASCDAIIDTCPVATDLAVFMNCLAFGGTYCRVGVPDGASCDFGYNWIPTIFTGKKIAGSVVAGPKRTQDMFALASAHGIDSEIEVVGFDKINETMDILEKGSNTAFRYVLKW
ncbi:hypothetical protein HDV03_004262 [Kappamyces sp. JEL0829]|nr:hypothetical protein HDV03_004262 [Kappamyces sp. JEL0829]KAJ3373728.1 hypothetical protein HDU91_006057 [Kappamyces sp. JEL0680]